ncbi:hypothetical protein JCM10212_002514 [Sporobolomyces blumeae]
MDSASDETWTGPTRFDAGPVESPTSARSAERSTTNRRSFGTFGPWRQAKGPEPRGPHYQTVSSTLHQRRSTTDSGSSVTQGVQSGHARRHSEHGLSTTNLEPPLPPLPSRPAHTINAVKRKPVPALAIEDEVDTVDDPLWNGEPDVPVPATPATQSRRMSYDPQDREEELIEARVRSLSIQELVGGATGLGFLVKEAYSAGSSRRGSSRDSKGASEKSRGRAGSDRAESFALDDYATYASTLPVLDMFGSATPSRSSSFARTTSSRSTSPPPAPKARPFALVRRQARGPLSAHGSIIPSLAKDSSRQKDEDLMDAWMDIIVGREDESETEKPALVFQSRPRMNPSLASRRSYRDVAHASQPVAAEPFTSHFLPSLVYPPDSRRSSIASQPEIQLINPWTRSTFDIRDDSDQSDEFHDANERFSTYGSDHDYLGPTLLPVPEVHTPLCRASPTVTTTASPIRFSPIVNRPVSSASEAEVPVEPVPTRRPSLSHQLLEAISASANGISHALPSKRRHTRSASVDCSTKIAPPRPPKSARRSSKTDGVAC